MKNKVIPRCKRTRWHSVIGDSSIHRVVAHMDGVCFESGLDSRFRGNDGAEDLQDWDDAKHRCGIAAFHG